MCEMVHMLETATKKKLKYTKNLYSIIQFHFTYKFNRVENVDLVAISE